MPEFVETSRRGIFSRTKNSVGGAIFGCLLVAGGSILLFWNEGRAVERYKNLKEGAGAVVSVPSADSVESANERKLVHLTGQAETDELLADPTFGISLPVIKLIRSVEMYQWVEDVRTESATTVGGTEETKKYYSYSKKWSSSLVDSTRFKMPADHVNPRNMKYTAESFVADTVNFGAFTLPSFLVEQIGGAEVIPANELTITNPTIKATSRIDGEALYFGESPQAPVVGDLRVTFSTVEPGPVSLVAQQAGSSFVGYTTATGSSLSLLERGTFTAEQMFQRAKDRNKALTWFIRIGGFFMLGIAFSMILGPLSVMSSVLPFLGRIVGAGTTVIAFIIAGILWTLVVAFAWLFYRPLIGIAFLVVTVGLIVLMVKKLNSPQAETQPTLSSETPPPLT